MNKWRNERLNQAVNWGMVLSSDKEAKVYPGDVDGVLERRGHFLFLEWKRTGAALPTGQRILLENLSKMRNMTALVLWGCYDTWRITDVMCVGTHTTPIPFDNERFLSYLRQWWRSSTRNPYDLG